MDGAIEEEGAGDQKENREDDDGAERLQVFPAAAATCGALGYDVLPW
jgi:hypothetical protein